MRLHSFSEARNALKFSNLSFHIFFFLTFGNLIITIFTFKILILLYFFLLKISLYIKKIYILLKNYTFKYTNYFFLCPFFKYYKIYLINIFNDVQKQNFVELCLDLQEIELKLLTEKSCISKISREPFSLRKAQNYRNAKLIIPPPLLFFINQTN